MDLVSALAQTFDHTHGVLAKVSAGQMTAPTPCREWDVAALITHLSGVVAGIGGALRGDAPPEGGFHLADDFAGQFRGIADATLEAWRESRLEGDTNIGAGVMPKSVAIGINLLDTTTHAWDVARATDQPSDLPDGLAELVLGICQGLITDDIRNVAGFDAPAPVGSDATPTERLVALLGRKL